MCAVWDDKWTNTWNRPQLWSWEKPHLLQSVGPICITVYIYIYSPISYSLKAYRVIIWLENPCLFHDEWITIYKWLLKTVVVSAIFQCCSHICTTAVMQNMKISQEICGLCCQTRPRAEWAQGYTWSRIEHVPTRMILWSVHSKKTSLTTDPQWSARFSQSEQTMETRSRYLEEPQP